MKKSVVVFGAGIMMLSWGVAHAQISQDGSTVTGPQSLSDATAASGVSTINQVFAGSDQPYMPGTTTAPLVNPTLFSILGKPAQIAGLPVLSQYFFSTAVHKIGKGESGNTRVVFNSAKLAKKTDTKERKIRFDFNGLAKGEVVGSLTVQSLKGSGEEVDFPTVLYDATSYIENLGELRGYDVLLLSVPDLISFSIGVDAKSRGISVAPVISGLFNGTVGALTGLSSGFSSSGGVTVPTAIVGCTFLIVLEDQTKQSIDLPRCFTKPLAQAQGVDGTAVSDGTISDSERKKQYVRLKEKEAIDEKETGKTSLSPSIRKKKLEEVKLKSSEIKTVEQQ